MDGKNLAWILAVVVVLGGVGFLGYNQGWFDKFTGPGENDACASVTCGDGTCNPTCETIANCAADCYNMCAAETCGNGQCSANCGETATTCAADCTSGQTNPPVVNPPTNTPVPVEDLRGSCKDKYTMAAVTAGNFSFYTPGADVSDPYVLELDSVDCGGNSTALIVQTNTNYDVYYHNDAATYYDEKLASWAVNYNPETGKGYLLIGGASYYGVTAVGAFVAVDTLPEVQTGMFDNGTDMISYNETALGGSGWFEVDIGNANSNSELKDVVLCLRDNDGDMEGTEITAFTASYVSGTTAITIPGSLQQYWEDAMGGSGAQCVAIASSLGSSQKARWQFTITATEANWAVDEEFEMTFDDLGDYLEKQYPSRNAKATAKTLTVGDVE